MNCGLRPIKHKSASNYGINVGKGTHSQLRKKYALVNNNYKMVEGCLDELPNIFSIKTDWIKKYIVDNKLSPFKSWIINNVNMVIVRIVNVRFQNKSNVISLPIINLIYVPDSKEMINVLNRVFLEYSDYPYIYIYQCGGLTSETLYKLNGYKLRDDSYINYYNIDQEIKLNDIYSIFY